MRVRPRDPRFHAIHLTIVLTFYNICRIKCGQLRDRQRYRPGPGAAAGQVPAASPRDRGRASLIVRDLLSTVAIPCT